MEKEVNPPTDFFKGIKTSLKSVLKHPDINLPKITNAVIKCNKIIIQTMMFMKLFLLDHYDKHNKLPIINDALFIATFDVKTVLVPPNTLLPVKV